MPVRLRDERRSLILARGIDPEQHNLYAERLSLQYPFAKILVTAENERHGDRSLSGQSEEVQDDQ